MPDLGHVARVKGARDAGEPKLPAGPDHIGVVEGNVKSGALRAVLEPRRRVRGTRADYPGSIPLALISGTVAGAVSSLIKSRAARWFGDCADTAAVNMM
jgi:hypothetical protein